MASSGNQHCANCIGTLSFPIDICRRQQSLAAGGVNAAARGARIDTNLFSKTSHAKAMLTLDFYRLVVIQGPDVPNILRRSYDNAKVMIDLRLTSNLPNILRRKQSFS